MPCHAMPPLTLIASAPSSNPSLILLLPFKSISPHSHTSLCPFNFAKTRPSRLLCRCSSSSSDSTSISISASASISTSTSVSTGTGTSTSISTGTSTNTNTRALSLSSAQRAPRKAAGLHSQLQIKDKGYNGKSNSKGKTANCQTKKADDLHTKSSALASALHHAKSADDVAQLLQEQDHFQDLNRPLCVSVIKNLGIAHRLDAALAFVEFVISTNTNSNSNSNTNGNDILIIYNTLLTAVRVSKRFYKAASVLEAMRSRGLHPDIITFNILMSLHVEQGKPQEVFSLLSQIEDAGLSPTPSTYSTILSAYKQMEDANGALQFFIKIREKYRLGQLQTRSESAKDWDVDFPKIQQSMLAICFSSMRRWLVKEGDNATQVLRLLTSLDRADVSLDRHFFERIVWACTREEHFPVVRELYKRLRESSQEGVPSLMVCNHIMWLMSKAKKWWAALEVYEEMLQKGPIPNNLSFELLVSNFTVLVTAAGRRGLWRWALKLLDKMHEKGFTPTTRQWNGVIIACSKAHETDTAVKIFKQMVKKGEKPTVHSYGALLSALTKEKLYDEALRVWDHMLKVGVKPNLHAYTILASMYAQKGDQDKVELVLKEMSEARIEPTAVTFNAIISGCVKGQMGAAGYEWFRRMEERNVKPDEISYEMVIGALTLDSKPRLAYQMYVRAYNEGLVLNRKAYDTVVEAGRAVGISMDLDNLGFHPDPFERRKPTKVKNIPSDIFGIPA